MYNVKDSINWFAAGVVFQYLYGRNKIRPFRPTGAAILDNPLFRRLGVISYTVYLIHDTAGMLLITRYGGFLGSWSPLAPFITIVIVFGFAELSYRLYEKNASRILKRVLFSRR
jgi:peptidoglycan/LPS O-acetylase OafA/YrhL